MIKAAIRKAREYNSKSIDSILSSVSVGGSIFTDPSEYNLYFSTLFEHANANIVGNVENNNNSSDQQQLAPLSIVALLLIPSGEIVQQSQAVSAEHAKLYLQAISVHVDDILNLWNKGKIEERHIDDLFKSIRSAAVICAEHKRSYITTSGIIYALAKLAKGSPSPHIFSSSDTLSATNIETDTGTGTSQQVLPTSTSSSSSSSNSFTQAHVEFLQCCILASQYSFASKFLNEYPIHNFNKKTISTENVLRYFYFKGIVHIGNQDYKSAVAAFSFCLAVPTKGIVSLITIEARKKIILAKRFLLFDYNFEEEAEERGRGSSASILAARASSSSSSTRGNIKKSVSLESMPLDHGSLIPASSSTPPSTLERNIKELPNAVSSTVFRYFTKSNSSHSHPARQASIASSITMALPSQSTIREQMDIYDSLISYYCNLNITSFLALLKKEETMISNDGNLGFFKQLIQLMQYRIIKKIARIYSVIPMKKLALKLGVGVNGGVDGNGDDMNTNNGIKEVIESLLFQLALKQNAEHAKNTIDFTIDSQSSVVYFYQDGFLDDENENESNAASMENKRIEREKAQMELSKRITVCMDLADRMMKMDIRLETSSKFQAIVSRENPEEAGTVSGTAAGSGSGGRRGHSVISDMF